MQGRQMTVQAKIPLSSLVRRTANTEALKTYIKACGATLSRKGRSRNWVLRANNVQIRHIIEIINRSGEDSWQWMAKKLAENMPPTSRDEILGLAKQNPAITVMQLVIASDCSPAEAREVLDALEWTD